MEPFHDDLSAESAGNKGTLPVQKDGAETGDIRNPDAIEYYTHWEKNDGISHLLSLQCRSNLVQQSCSGIGESKGRRILIAWL